MSKGTDNQPTLVTVELEELGEYCELTLTHERFVKPEAVRQHEKGWTDIVNKLAAYFERKAPNRARDRHDFDLKLKFAVPPQKLYEQFSTAEGVRHWWTQVCQIEERVGGTATFRFPKAGFYVIARIVRLEPDRCVEWICTDSKHPEASGFSDLRDWVGTTLRFEITPLESGHSQLTFTHTGLAPLECFGVCSNTWALYLNDSLLAACCFCLRCPPSSSSSGNSDNWRENRP
ncbi:MAG: SRPBCC domain-containing protein [Candidatus Acidiferrales bacterium]